MDTFIRVRKQIAAGKDEAARQVHRNLTQQLMQAERDLSTAISSVSACAPHMRDYYPYEDAEKAFAEAQRGHFARLDQLKAVRDELSAVLGSVNEQEQNRRRAWSTP